MTNKDINLIKLVKNKGDCIKPNITCDKCPVAEICVFDKHTGLNTTKLYELAVDKYLETHSKEELTAVLL